MTIIKSAYDTFIGRAYRTDTMKKITQAIEDIMLESADLQSNAEGFAINTHTASSNAPESYNAGLVTFLSPKEAAIPPFVFPLVVENPNNIVGQHRNFVVVGDGRPYMRAARESRAPSTVVNKMEFSLLRTLLGLNALWLQQGPIALANLGQVQHKVFSRWLGNVISSHYELDVTERQKVRVLAGYYYQCLFVDGENFTETMKTSMVGTTAQTAGVNYQITSETLANVEHIPNIDVFISELKTALANPKLDSLNIGLLSKKIGMTWFGFNGRELACAALEHPPTFVALLYNSFAQNSYRRAALAKVSEEFRGNGGGSELVRTVETTVFY